MVSLKKTCSLSLSSTTNPPPLSPYFVNSVFQVISTRSSWAGYYFALDRLPSFRWSIVRWLFPWSSRAGELLMMPQTHQGIHPVLLGRSVRIFCNNIFIYFTCAPYYSLCTILLINNIHVRKLCYFECGQKFCSNKKIHELWLLAVDYYSLYPVCWWWWRLRADWSFRWWHRGRANQEDPWNWSRRSCRTTGHFWTSCCGYRH